MTERGTRWSIRVGGMNIKLNTECDYSYHASAKIRKRENTKVYFMFMIRQASGTNAVFCRSEAGLLKV